MKFLSKRSNSIPDEELIELVKKRDQAAYAQLVERYMTAVFQFSYSFIQNVEKAEDVTQETFMLLWDKPHSWQPTGQLKSWLFRVARNKCIDNIRLQKPHIELEKTLVFDDRQSPEKDVFDQEMTKIIDKYIHQLPDRQREAIQLVHLLECSNIEAAEAMEISVDALESLLARGRRKLRVMLEGHKHQYFAGGTL